MSRCEACGSVRVVLISVLEDLAGPNWRDAFDDATALRAEDVAEYERTRG
jgi:hypothetical protein